MRLKVTQPGCTRFALRVSDATFSGSTHERLVKKQGRTIFTEALAGSLPSPKTADEKASAAARAELLGSKKDRTERTLFVREIMERLHPLCESVSAPLTPSVKATRHVLHLHTPIKAVLRADSHILELVGLLHPTPAVAGLPTAVAVARIAEQEPTPRGYYAGPIGWFDHDGDGEFAVALRSAV